MDPVPLRAPPTDSEVLDELDRAVSGASFARSPRSRAFLSYVVTETLAGRADRLSERTIGRYVLGRDATFDGRFDASVRVQATRVRRALYELGASPSPLAVRIVLPLGTYAPRFERVHAATNAGDSGVAVVSFVATGPDPAAQLAEAVSEAVVRRLSTFPGIRVVGPLRNAPTRESASGQGDPQTHPRFVLEGRVAVSGGRARLGASLTDLLGGETLWSTTDTLGLDQAAQFGIEDAWAGHIASEIGDYAGVVLRASSASVDPSAPPTGRSAVLAFYAYIASGEMRSLDAAEVALERAMASGDRSPDVLAMRASTLAVRAAYGRSDDLDGDLALAEDLARRALDSDRLASHCHGALGTVALVRGQLELVRAHATAAAQAGPYHPTNLGTAGTLLAYAGAWSQGLAILREAISLSPHRLSYGRGLIALDDILAGDDEAALAEANQIAAPDAEWGPLYRALALAGLGEHQLARAQLDRAALIEPTLGNDPEAYFTRLASLTEEQLEVLRSRMRVLLDEGADRPPT